MKTDQALTMDEYLNQMCAVPKRIGPPAADARRIPIIAEDNLASHKESHGCRCDRWGHPCWDCVEPKRKLPLKNFR